MVLRLTHLPSHKAWTERGTFVDCLGMTKTNFHGWELEQTNLFFPDFTNSINVKSLFHTLAVPCVLSSPLRMGKKTLRKSVFHVCCSYFGTSSIAHTCGPFTEKMGPTPSVWPRASGCNILPSFAWGGQAPHSAIPPSTCTWIAFRAAVVGRRHFTRLFVFGNFTLLTGP